MRNLHAAFLIAALLIVSLAAATTRADTPVPTLTELYAYNVPIPKYDSSQVRPDGTNPTFLNIAWQGVDVDENGIWSGNSTYLTVQSPGYYHLDFSGCVISSNSTATLTRFHAAVISQGQRSQYTTQVVNLSNAASQWLNIAWTYHITDPAHQFIYAQLESNQAGTYICQARFQILRMG